jgi:hypothetical protein
LIFVFSFLLSLLPAFAVFEVQAILTAAVTGLRQDATLSLPIRQTASIFKQPVTIVSNHPDSKTRTDLRHGVQEQPRQVCDRFSYFINQQGLGHFA